MTAPTVIAAAVEYAHASRAYRLAEECGPVPDAAVKRVRYARRALDATRQRVPCSTCGDDLSGLLAQCDKPACLSAEVAEDAAISRSEDI